RPGGESSPTLTTSSVACLIGAFAVGTCPSIDGEDNGTRTQTPTTKKRSHISDEKSRTDKFLISPSFGQTSCSHLTCIFNFVKVIATISRARVRRAIVGRIPF